MPRGGSCCGQQVLIPRDFRGEQNVSQNAQLRDRRSQHSSSGSLPHQLRLALGVPTPLTSEQHLPEKVSDLQCVRAEGCQPEASEPSWNCPLQLQLPSEVRSGDAALGTKAIQGAVPCLPSATERSTALDDWDPGLPGLMPVSLTPFSPLHSPTTGCELLRTGVLTLHF